MDILDFALDDMVIFELPTVEALVTFRDRLRARWDGWSDADAQVWLFTARLSTEADLAGLLREAQYLLADLGVASIRFFLDGRLYTLESAEPPFSRRVDLAAKSE